MPEVIEYPELIGQAVQRAAEAKEEYGEAHGYAEDKWFEVGVGDCLVRINADSESVDVQILVESRDASGIPSQMRWSAVSSIWGLAAFERTTEVENTAIPMIAECIALVCIDGS